MNFSRARMKVHYSGILNLKSDSNNLGRNAKFNESYKLFQKERKESFGKPVLKIDIQNFFNSIKINKLAQKLRRYIGDNELIDDLVYLFQSC
ncbi:hypothetical protein R0J90_15820, partial [Micrococcus sp. SIMBA_144]